LQKSYFESRIKILCDFAEIDTSKHLIIDGEDVKINFKEVFE